jgi:hypothetical protein
VDVRAIAHLAVNSHRAWLVGAGDEGARGPLSGTETALNTTGPTDRRGVIASGIDMQASVVSLEEPGEDGDADQRGKQGEHNEGAEMGGSTIEKEEER